ncbi:MAG: thiol peroxidase [Roseivirga sp.]
MAQITLGGTPTNTNGNLPANGSTLADHALIKADLSAVSLSELKGKKVILNIFPSVDTSVCATSVRKFNQEAASLDNTAVVCVSKDLPFALGRFCGAEGIENALAVSDFRTPAFAEELGLLIIDGAFTGLDARAVVVLDEEGKVIHSELVPEVGQEPNYEAALAVL